MKQDVRRVEAVVIGHMISYSPRRTVKRDVGMEQVYTANIRGWLQISAEGKLRLVRCPNQYGVLYLEEEYPTINDEAALLQVLWERHPIGEELSVMEKQVLRRDRRVTQYDLFQDDLSPVAENREPLHRGMVHLDQLLLEALAAELPEEEKLA